MPSWSLHKKIYKMLSEEVEGFVIFTPDLINRIDKIIDEAYGEHDLGRDPDAASFWKLLNALFIEFGDIYDLKLGRFLNITRQERIEFVHSPEWWRRIQEEPERYLIHIPDDALVLALLHHILDLAMKCLLDRGITIERSGEMILCAYEKIRQYYIHSQLGLLSTSIGIGTFADVLEWLIRILIEKSKQLYNLFLTELKSKGLELGLGPRAIRDCMVHYVKERGYYGIVYIDGTPLPVAAAASKVYSKLRRGEGATIGFAKAPYLIVERITVSSLKELVEKLGC